MRRRRRRARSRPRHPHATRRPSPTSKTPAGKPSSARISPTAPDKRVRGRSPRLGQRRRLAGDLVEQGRVLALATGSLVVETAESFELGQGAFAVGDDGRLILAVPALERVDRRRGAPRARRSAAGSWSMPSARSRISAATSVSSASRPVEPFRQRFEPRRRAGPGPRASRTATAVASRAPAPSAVSASWTVAAPRAIASPCWAAARRARISSASPGRRRAAGDLGRLVLEQVHATGQLARFDRQARPAPRGWRAIARRRRPCDARAGPCPPNASSRSRCQRSSSSRC